MGAGAAAAASSQPGGDASQKEGDLAKSVAHGSNGYSLVARALKAAGIRHMFGVIGIPVTELASAAQVRYMPQKAGLSGLSCDMGCEFERVPGQHAGLLAAGATKQPTSLWLPFLRLLWQPIGVCWLRSLA